MRWLRHLVGLVLLGLAVWYLAGIVDGPALALSTASVLGDPLGLVLAVGCYAAAFGLRAWAWRAVLPGLPAGQSWAAIHVSLLGNHVLPFRLGEVLRVTSVLRRTTMTAGPVVASTITLRAADVAAVLALALLAAPAVLGWLAGEWLVVIAALVLAVGVAGGWWMWRIARAGSQGSRAIRLPGPVLLSGLLAAVVLAWVLEAAVVWQVARIAGFPLSVGAAVAVTAVTIAVQFVAVTPGGFGSYEAAATAVLVALGVPAGPAFGIALTTHLVKTGYALVVGGVALAVPAPAYWGRLRLPRSLPARPSRAPVDDGSPVVTFLPAHDEQDSVGEVVRRLPAAVAGHPVVALVVDDGSTDQTADRALAAGARVVRMGVNKGLGAAVRRGLAEAIALRPAVVVYLDADGEYFPEDIERVAAPVISGRADYVVGSRFSGQIETMLARRRLGNQALTAALRFVARRPDLTDGQSGFRAFSPSAAAAAEIVHDYNYAQVLTLDLLDKGYRYAEVPIHYRFRTTGASFIRLGRYLRRVVPAVYRELNGGTGQSSTTWASKRRRAEAHPVASNPSGTAVSASTAS